MVDGDFSCETKQHVQGEIAGSNVCMGCDSCPSHFCQERRWHLELAVCSEFSCVTVQQCPGVVVYKVNVFQIFFSRSFRKINLACAGLDPWS